MSDPLLPQTINRRYVLERELGAGGMGAVYQAVDRLTGRTIAFKQLKQPGLHTKQSMEMALALAQEFKALASLRHPHIISVLDYGFNEQLEPFFTMQLLPAAQTILASGQNDSIAEQITLLLQLLQALDYLYRRGIIHRDLKPANVLVADNQVRVLDFGLATQSQGEPSETTAGTLAYMAPEVILEGVASAQSDLYAVGVMAYELLTGFHPFNQASMDRLLSDIIFTTPDFSPIESEPALVAVLARLLAKQPAERYQDAHQVIQALCAATNRPLPAETIEIRESFLQAADFVGRQAETAQLVGALDRLWEVEGSVWLVGGESGVGKSRFLDELRTLALVEGALVLRGQSVQEGGRPYELWRDVLRWLALTADLTLEEATVLKPVIPDINALIGQEVADAPPLDPPTTQSRLFRVIVDLFRRQSRPLVVILEDLQWTGSASLALLGRLKQALAGSPLLFIGSYRNDERPALPTMLPGVHLITLERLNAAETARLSTSVLGRVGQEPEIIRLLQQETEGNPFFLVEIVRALAEHVGQLDKVNPATLPSEIFTTGIQQIVERRLKQISADYQPLLHLAALAGRPLDLALLQLLAPGIALDDWLTTCANAAIIEIHDEQWLFSHDKLRQGVVEQIPHQSRPRLHEQIVQALEALYADVPAYYGSLAYHWAMAANHTQEKQYSIRAGQVALKNGATAEAARYFSRAIDLTAADDHKERYRLLLAREEAYDMGGNRVPQFDDLTVLRKLSLTLSRREQVEISLRQAKYGWSINDYEASIAAAREAVDMAQANSWPELAVSAYPLWGASLVRLGRREEAFTCLQQGLTLARSSTSRQVQADCLRALGTLSHLTGNPDSFRQYGLESLHLSRELGDRRGEASSLSGLGNAAYAKGDYAEAHVYYEQALRLAHEIGDRLDEVIIHHNLSGLAIAYGNYRQARIQTEQVLDLAAEINSQAIRGYALDNLNRIALEENQPQEAVERAEQAVQLAQEMRDRRLETMALNKLGHVRLYQKKLSLAQENYATSLAILQEIDLPYMAMESISGLAAVSLANSEFTDALQHVEKILAFLANHTLDSAEEPFRVYWTCYQVLLANQDGRAQTVLQNAHDLLQSQAAKISDTAMHQSFMEGVTLHRQIVAAWQANQR
jgi:tetratricopeptide (TPR) repeat protein